MTDRIREAARRTTGRHLFLLLDAEASSEKARTRPAAVVTFDARGHNLATVCRRGTGEREGRRTRGERRETRLHAKHPPRSRLAR